MKTCSTCKIEKPFEEFGNSSKTKDGKYRHCYICSRENCRKWKLKNKEKISKYNKEYYSLDPQHHVKRAADWAKNNKEKFKSSNIKSCKKWRLSNKDSLNNKAARRRASKLQAKPSWLTQEQLQEIKDLYTICQMFKIYTGLTYHVDHIIPLVNPIVCGLHVPWNLQILEASENLSKHNKFIE